MTCGEIFDILKSRGCSDLTPWLDERSCSQYPVSTGGYGDVFRAKLTNGHEVAIKTIRIYDNNGTSEGRYAKHAAREIYAWSKCKHRNVAQLVGIIVFRGCLAMVSWWAGNGNVVSYLKRWPNVSRCQMSLSISTGLAYLHEQDIVHGDLKGANVLVGHDGNPMLADFGNASIADATLHFTQTATGPSFSPRWAAPEILSGTSGHTKLADIYSLGMTIIEVFTGKVPYPGVNDYALPLHIAVHLKKPDRPLDVIPDNSVLGNVLWAILMSCWSHNPPQRPSAQDMQHLMGTISDDKLVPVAGTSG
ncbi:Interleukin-1 receptor-associated kinase 4 [Rhizoctonia solani]|uniref:Interleukin-1 receptor-associated kinase 4 n=1 Tax=Rhizoctonia solani TaxID=456999 RepID=A0A0K6GEV6_9AGAM|nr:Interleukin-1 receptor-associated kinase 4 [Rhizoctonia solani]